MEEIPANLIRPLHEPRMPQALKDMVNDMKENGWHGRPLLVIGCEEHFQGWTGSHRLAAAIIAGIDSIPCHVVEESDLAERGFHASSGHVDDSDRLAIVREIGDEDAIAIMWAEGRDN